MPRNMEQLSAIHDGFNLEVQAFYRINIGDVYYKHLTFLLSADMGLNVFSMRSTLDEAFKRTEKVQVAGQWQDIAQWLMPGLLI